MQNQLSKQPFFILLIPIFFVLHGVKENFGFIGFNDTGLLLLIYLAGTIISFLFVFIFFRNKIKASLFAGWLVIICLFYGAIQDFFKDHIIILSKYSILFSILLISTIGLLIVLKKSKKDFPKLVLYLNIIFLIYVTVDLISITVKTINPPPNKFAIFPFAKTNAYAETGTSKKHDIYFLLFDEYASSLSLKQQYNFNNDLDSVLLKKGFHIQQKSYSNYNITTFSMASMLNMSYLQGVSNQMQITAADYNYCRKLIRDNEAIKFLSTQGYNIINYSIFDLAGNPSPLKQTILPLKTRLITQKTLFSRMNKDLGWILYTPHLGITLKKSTGFLNDLTRDNDAMLDSVIRRSAVTSAQPSFIYAHFYMPHDPFIYDKTGNFREVKTIYTESTGASKPYLEYVEYVNSKIKNLINVVQSNTKNNAVIILMGDHGFREKWDTHASYQNMNAVYLPDNDYHLLYDSISCVNQFRIIFNTLFNQSFKLQKDSTIFLEKGH